MAVLQSTLDQSPRPIENIENYKGWDMIKVEALFRRIVMFKWVRKWRARKLCKSTPWYRREKCIICGGPIFIGQYVAEPSRGGLVHAGYHLDPTSGEDRFCETAAVGCGVWDGRQVFHHNKLKGIF